jgi:hypothetical protein
VAAGGNTRASGWRRKVVSDRIGAADPGWR